MRAVIQRVKHAKLTVNKQVVSNIDHGLLILLGVGVNDTKKDAEYMADKLSKLRIFEDQNGKMNLSANDVGAKYLLVSNFTLYGDAKGSNRPSFTQAARPEQALPLFNHTAELLNQKVPTCLGVFGEEMFIDMTADGPTTIILSTDN